MKPKNRDFVVRALLGLATLLMSALCFFTSQVYLGQNRQNDMTDTIFFRTQHIQWQLQSFEKDNNARNQDWTDQCSKQRIRDSIQDYRIQFLEKRKNAGTGYGTAYK